MIVKFILKEMLIFDFEKYIDENRYSYSAIITDIYDGDTVTCNIDVGFGIILHKRKIRLLGVNTPEVRGEEREECLKARDWLRELVLGKEIILYTVKDRNNINKKGKYGRLLGIIYYNDENINKKLVDKGFAHYAFY